MIGRNGGAHGDPDAGRGAHHPGRRVDAGQLFLIGAPQHIPGFADVLPHFPHLN